MNLKQIRTFARIAELGSLSKAASAMGVAQSLVSRQISLLEEAWGDRLFERTGRGMVLSDFGRRMRPEVDFVIDRIERLARLANDSAGVLTGTVHIGVLPSMSRELLPALLADLKATAPAVRLHISEGFSGDLDEQLSLGRLDMIVVNRYGRDRIQNEDILGKVDTFLVGLPESIAALNASDHLTFDGLDGLAMVLPSNPNGLRTLLDVLGRQRNVRPDIVVEVDTLTAMKDIAMSGYAYTLLPMLAVRSEVAAGKLAVVKVDHPAIQRTIALRLSTHRPLSKSARMVGARIRVIVSELLNH